MIVKIFDRNEEYRVEAEVFNFRHLHEINRLDMLTGYTLEPIDKGEKILYQHRTGKWYEFIVDAPEIIHEEGTQYHFTAINSLVEIDGDWIEDKRPSTLSAAVVSILEPTRWTMGNVTNKPNIGLTFYRVTAREALDILLENYPVEFQTRIEVGTSGVVTRTLDVLDRIGGDYGKRFVYNRDLTSVKRTYRQGKVVTALYGFGKGEEVGDGFGRRIDFSSINNGYPYVYNPAILAEYGRLENGVRKHVFDSVVFDDVDDKTKLLQLTQDEYAKRCRPQVSYEGTVVDLGLEHEKVGIGDTVKVIDGGHRFETRINYLMENEDFQNEIRLANYIMNITDSNNALIKKVGELATNAGVWDEAQKIVDGSYMDGLIDKLNDQANASGGWTFIKEGEGLLTINAPTEATATKAVNIVGGTVRVASQKNSNGSWKWRTFITGDQIAADMISTGILKGGMVHWNLDTGVLYIGATPETASLYWDGSNLKLNVTSLQINSKDVATEESVSGAIDSATSPLITRISQAESKITPTAITDTVSEATDQDGEPLFAKTAETKLMADNWTARFGYIGGKNLIKNSEELDFMPWEGSNVTVTPGIIVSAWGATNAIRVNATSGNGTAFLKAFASLYTNHAEMRGKTYTLSCYVRNDRTDADVTIHSLRFGGVTLKPKESKRIVITGSSTVDASVQLQIWGQTPAHYAEVTIWHPQLELGEVVTDWRPHSDELYAGYTRIDQDGVTVGKDFGDTETSLHSSGMIAKTKSGETLLEVDPTRSYIPHLHADNIYADNIVMKIGRYGGLIQRGVWLDNVARGDGSGRDINNTSDNLKEALDYATEGGSVLNNAVVSVNVLGVKHVGNWEIKGYTGNGSVELYFYPGATLNGSIDLIDNSCRVLVRAAELGNGKIIRASARDTILIRNCSAVELTRIAVIHPSASDYPLNIENSRVLVNRCDLSGNSTAFPQAAANIALNSQTYFDNCSGNTTDAVYRYTTGSSVVSYQYRPKASNTTEPFTGSLGHVKAVDDIAMESRVVVPAISWAPITKTFAARLHRITQSTGYRTNGSFVQGTSPNNRSQAYRGYASWGSAIYDWLRANGGYQNISSIKLYATRGGFGYGDSDLIFTNPAARTIPAIPRFGTKFVELKGYTLGDLVENSTDLTINTTTLSTANYADFTKIWVSITVSKRA